MKLLFFFAVLIQKDRGNGPDDVLATFSPGEVGKIGANSQSPTKEAKISGHSLKALSG